MVSLRYLAAAPRIRSPNAKSSRGTINASEDNLRFSSETLYVYP